jgi:hypothetical protein
MRRILFLSVITIGLLTLLLTSSGRSLRADGGPNHQGINSRFGVSGGNVNDITKRFCCSGTLGALVRDSAGVDYILSNNHVLGRSGQAAPGEDISQPGRIDNNCDLPAIVADFTLAPTLGSSNVDAAIAQLRAGAMNTSGEIEDIGIPSSVVKAPTVGLAVTKSGRTSGTTTGTISSINTSVSVQYQSGCGQGKKFVVSYTNQVVIGPGTFSAGGDSGSLIVTDDNCNQPVALLFAGSSTTTIGNPVGQVLTQLSGALGRSVGFVGQNCGTALTFDSNLDLGPSREAIQFATQAMRGREQDLLSRTGVIGVGVGARDEDQTEAAIVIYVDRTTGVSGRLPRRINGVRVKVVYTDQFVAF